MNILVTGCAGFIGYNLCRVILDKNNKYNLFGIDNLNKYYDVSLKKNRLLNLKNSSRFKFIKMDLSKDIYHKIKNIQKVSGFLGPEGKPVPVSENEVKKIMDQLSQSQSSPAAGISFEIGEKVRICDGAFASFSGLVEEINEEKSRLKVSVSVFGRPVPVELEYNQVEKN